MFQRLAALIIGAALLPLSGCLDASIVDDLATEVRISGTGQPGAAYEVRKRFRFSRSPLDASGISLAGGRLTILAPDGADLSFLHRLSVYVETADFERVLLAQGEAFEAGARYSEMDIVYPDDLRQFVGQDSRITLVFVLEPSAWYRPFPADGITVLARASVLIEL